MLTRPCSQEVNHNRNNSKKQGGNIKRGKSGKTSSRELKDKCPLYQNYFETEEAFYLETNTKQLRIFILTKISPNTNKGKVKFV